MDQATGATAPSSPLRAVLERFRTAAASEREKGTYFEDLITCYLREEPMYRDLYSDVWTYAEWAQLQGLDKRDAGIDLVARTAATGEFHAIQCKLFAEDYKLQKADIDSFFTASGKKHFAQRLIVTSTNNWSEHAEDALIGQQPPVLKIDLAALEASQIDWSKYGRSATPVLRKKKELRPHQVRAKDVTLAGMENVDRGKLIMACGTGKTFTSLKIAESMVGPGGMVLFLVPSLALLSQSLTEWTQESETPLHSFAVCSDSDVGKKRSKDDDVVQTLTHELRFPATTDPARLASAVSKRHDPEHMTVVFATYHSIDVVHRAQAEHGLGQFSLVVCDEAHRTTGATFGDEDESNFVKVHDGAYIAAAKRLYMTATPRIYGEHAKASAEKDNVALCSMDDPALFGPELHVITFSEAVKRGLLVDYKVIVLAVEEKHVNRRLQKMLSDENNQVKVDDAAKIIGCWKALSKQGLAESLMGDERPMQRAVAFCQVIEVAKGAKTHKTSSKNIAGMFKAVVDAYKESVADDEDAREEASIKLACEAEHVDGSMNASKKEEKLAWLKAEPPEETCRILSNVRCLSEGVDVPALDAVLFLTPRSSQVEVVQSVGRVMRTTPDGKKRRGYVVLPVVIPAGVEPHEALNDNKTYKVVWQVLQALRSHDDRFDAMVNKLDLIGRDTSKMEVIAVTDKVQRKSKAPKGADKEKAKRTELAKRAKRGSTIGVGTGEKESQPEQIGLEFEIGEIEKAMYAKLVEKVGNRHHWEDWANDIAKIARTHIDRINALLENPANVKEREAFSSFAAELRDDLNDSITDGEIVEMLAQHLITKPVFDALFEGYSFASQNPMSQAMQAVLEVLQEHNLDKEADTLQAFYESVKLRASGIENAAGKQKIVVELYDKFFRNAFPKMTERLGIVYTPVEVVDFIIHSVNDVLQAEFGQTLGSKGVHINDPFTGTGTFITRLLQSGLISPEQLRDKYKGEIHANELVLLAYYIAAINIEAVYHSIVGGEYVPFEGICLTDTFQLYEKDDLVSSLLADNGSRRRRQKSLDIRVIIGNPPYSVGQESANDNNQNVSYPYLDERIRSTYVARSQSSNLRNLYDSYIRAIRWASDRIGKSGVVGFVTNAGFVDATTADGLRRCLFEEFTAVYIFHLRGNARTQGERRRAEGGNVFDLGSRAPIAISILVKNPHGDRTGAINFFDIGDYLSIDQKLRKIEELGSIAGITRDAEWTQIVPDEHADWLKQRDGSFSEFIAIGDKKGSEAKLFHNFSAGLTTARDAWCFNPSKTKLKHKIQETIGFYNRELDRFNALHGGLETKARLERMDAAVSADPAAISWTRGLRQDFARNKPLAYADDSVVPAVYRPFSRQWVYFNRRFNEYVYQLHHLWPTATSTNLAIMVKQRWSGVGQIALMIDQIPEFQTDGGTQCFPRYLYSPAQPEVEDQESLFEDAASTEKSWVRRDAITDEGLEHFRLAYPGQEVDAESVFFYCYGLLHSPDYLEQYGDNLTKELPRIPCVASYTDFQAFCAAGKKLGSMHARFDDVALFPAKVEGDDLAKPARLDSASYRVEKMRFGKVGKEKDQTTIHYNDKITVRGIPLEAYEYVVNGKTAIEWVMERQIRKTDKDSGIVSDANDWATETVANPRYPLELLLRIVTVSVETMKIIKSLPRLAA